MPGHPDVHQHDVGRVARRPRRGTSAPSAASPTTSQVRRAAEHHRQPGAHQRVVVDDRAPGPVATLGHVGTASGAWPAAGTRRPPVAAVLAAGPPARLTRSAQADQAGAGAGDRRRRRRRPAAGCVPRRQPVAGPPLDAGRRPRRPARACGRWSAPPARSGTRCARRRRQRGPGRRTRSSSVDPHAGRAGDSSTSSAGRPRRRLRPACRRVAVARLVAQHADHLPQVLQRLRARWPGSRRRPRATSAAGRPGGSPARRRAG